MSNDRRNFLRNCAAGSAGLAALAGLRSEPQTLGSWFVANRKDLDRVASFIAGEIEKLIAMKITSCPGRGPRVPYPIIPVGSISAWQNMYYWDTYFTVRLLLGLGRVKVAQEQVENCLALFKRFGYVPNANRYEWATRSQPPLLSGMARLVYEREPDHDFLGSCYAALKREYEEFWLGPLHLAPGTSFSRYQDGGCGLTRLLGYPVNRLAHLQAEAESGWDFTPRFDNRCLEFLPVDLNSFLYKYELDLAWMAQELKLPEQDLWQDRAERRRRDFNATFWDQERQFYFDYDFRNRRIGQVYSLAGFLPLWTGLAEGKNAEGAAKALGRFEHEFGLAVCDRDYDMKNKQWNWPNAWPPATWWAEEGLRAYGFLEDAERMARKYLGAQTGLFKERGAIFEKYNALSGSTDVTGGHERGTSPMLGWSASTFLDFYNLAREAAEEQGRPQCSLNRT